MDQRITFVTWASQLEEVDQWRFKFRPIPTRNEAIRRLIELGLKASSESEIGGSDDAE